MKAAMLRERQTVSQGGLSPHDMHCHQYLAILRLCYRACCFSRGARQYHSARRRLQAFRPGTPPDRAEVVAALHSPYTLPMNWRPIALSVMLTAVPTVPASAQPAPRLEYGTPDGFYRTAADAPVQFDAFDGDVRIFIFTFQPLRDDLAAHFGRNLLSDLLPAEYRETQLLVQPRFFAPPVAGADQVVAVQFQENFQGARRERLRIAIRSSGTVAIVEVASGNAAAYERLRPSLEKFLLAMVVRATDSAVSTPRAGAAVVPGSPLMPGLYMGTVQRLRPNVLGPPGSTTTVIASTYYLFSGDGRVYRSTELPSAPRGIRSFDYDAALRRDPGNSGTYTADAANLRIRLGGPNPEAIAAKLLGNGAIEIYGITFTHVAMQP
jgi:hypothetical protein